jgi:hypothetical protein
LFPLRVAAVSWVGSQDGSKNLVNSLSDRLGLFFMQEMATVGDHPAQVRHARSGAVGKASDAG